MCSFYCVSVRRAELQEDDRVRRSEGEQLLDFFSGPWWSRKIVHHCRGCCTSRRDAVAKATLYINRLWTKRLGLSASMNVHDDDWCDDIMSSTMKCPMLMAEFKLSCLVAHILHANLGRIQTPALNRWLSVWPVMGVLAVLFNLHFIFPRAYLQLEASADTSGSSSDDAQLGAPRDEMRVGTSVEWWTPSFGFQTFIDSRSPW